VPVDALHAAQKVVAGEPRLRVLYHVCSGCRDSRGHLNSNVGRLYACKESEALKRDMDLARAILLELEELLMMDFQF
jgi:hypothetical protein